MTPLGLRKKILVSFLVLICAWLAGLAWFIGQIPNRQAHIAPVAADAIIVLTGGSGRLEYALTLLSQDKAPTLFVSGAGEDVTLADIIRQAPQDTRDIIKPSTITLGHTAENTIGNAEESSLWLQKKHYKTIVLVTANYHMPRALLEFSATIPGLSIIPAPMIPADFTFENWASLADSRVLLLSEYHKYLASKLRHLFVSATRHT